MAEKELLKTLEEDTRQECASIIEDAQKESDGIIKKAVEELERMKKERLEQAKASLQEERIRRLADARLHANEVILRQRQLAVTKVLDGAGGKLKEFRKEKEYPDILKRLFMEAVAEWRSKMAVVSGDSKAKIIMSKQDVPLIKDAINKSGYDIVTDGAEDMPPGIIIASRDEKFKVVNTLRARLEMARPPLVSMIGKMLFAEKWT